jgi:hypothetical protein
MNKINFLSIKNNTEYSNVDFYGLTYTVRTDLTYNIMLIGSPDTLEWFVSNITGIPRETFSLDYDIATGKIESNYPYYQK